MENVLREKLERAAEPSYKAFAERITATGYPVLGVRMGKLRSLVKSAGPIPKPVPAQAAYEEVMAYGIQLAADKRGFLSKAPELEEYLSMVDSWALIDSVCSSFSIKESELEGVYAYLKGLLEKGRLLGKGSPL